RAAPRVECTGAPGGGAIAPPREPNTVQRAMEPLFGVFPVPDAERQDAVVEQVLLADRLWLEPVCIPDHPHQPRPLDASTVLSSLAGRTERVRFFPDVANLPLRHPALLSKS